MPTLLQKRHAQDALACILLLLAAAAAYSQVVFCDFINLDDQLYVTENPHVLKGLTVAGLRWALGFESNAYFSPLAWLSFMLDVQIFGPKAGALHLVNAVLHGLDAVLLFLFFRRATGALWPSLAVAALFAVHPMHVESVAWITARKDVLSALFWLLAMHLHLSYARRPSVPRQAAVLLAVAMGLLVKPILMTIPVALLLLDVWPLGRTRLWSPPAPEAGWPPPPTPVATARLLLEKLPLLILSLASLAVSWLSFQGKAETELSYPLSLCLANTTVALTTYLGKLFWPSGIAIIHPFLETVPGWQTAASAALLAGLTMLSLRFFRSRPHLAVGWLWFLVTIAPTLKLFSLGQWFLIAARFVHIPYIGLYAALSFEAAALARRWRIKPLALGAACGAVLLALIIDTRIHVGYWRNSVTLFRHALEVTERNWKAHFHLACALQDEGRTAEALPQFAKALEIFPRSTLILNKYGTALAQGGNHAAALSAFQAAANIQPDSFSLALNLGLTLARLNRPLEALFWLRKAVALEPNQPDAERYLGDVLVKLGRPTEALGHLERAARLAPNKAGTLRDLALAMLVQGRTREALPHLERALALEPDNFETTFNLGLALYNLGKLSLAEQRLREALRIEPNAFQARYHLASVLAANGQPRLAVAELQEVIRQRPDAPEPHALLADVLVRLGDAQAARGHREQAARLAAAKPAVPAR